MAGEDMMGYLSGLQVHEHVAAGIDIRFTMSVGQLFVFDLFNQAPDNKEVRAWERLIKQYQPLSVGLCLSKSDLHPKVSELLKPHYERMQNATATDLHDDDLLDYGHNLEELADAFVHQGQLRGIVNLLKAQDVNYRCYLISSTGLLNEGKMVEFSAEFVALNTFSPVLDIVEHLQKQFRTSFIERQLQKTVSNRWQRKIEEAVSLSGNKNYSQAITILKSVPKDKIRQSFELSVRFYAACEKIYFDWLSQRSWFLQDNNLGLLVNNISKFEEEYIINRNESNNLLERYKEQTTHAFQSAISQTSESMSEYTRYLSGVDILLQSLQSIDEKTEIEEHVRDLLTQEAQKLRVEASKWSALVYTLQDIEVHKPYADVLTKMIALREALRLMFKEHKLSWNIDSFVTFDDIRLPLDVLMESLCRLGKNYISYTALIAYMQAIYQRWKNAQHYLSQTELERKLSLIASYRERAFEALPNRQDMVRKRHTKEWIQDENVAAYYAEWKAWTKSSDKYRPSRAILRRFPEELLMCPVCIGKGEVMHRCVHCSSWSYLKRLFTRCLNCNNKMWIASPCENCGGTGTRKDI